MAKAAVIPKDTQSADFISCKAAAAAVALSEVSIRRMLTKRQLTRYKLNGRTLVSKAELFSLIRKIA